MAGYDLSKPSHRVLTAACFAGGAALATALGSGMAPWAAAIAGFTTNLASGDLLHLLQRRLACRPEALGADGLSGAIGEALAAAIRSAARDAGPDRQALEGMAAHAPAFWEPIAQQQIPDFCASACAQAARPAGAAGPTEAPTIDDDAWRSLLGELARLAGEQPSSVGLEAAVRECGGSFAGLLHDTVKRDALAGSKDYPSILPGLVVETHHLHAHQHTLEDVIRQLLDELVRRGSGPIPAPEARADASEDPVLLRAYLARLVQTHERVDHTGHEDAGDENPKLVEVYVELNAVEDRPQVDRRFLRDELEELERNAQSEDDPALRQEGLREVERMRQELEAWVRHHSPETPGSPGIPISRILERHPRVVLLGDPGSGKTTVVRYVVLEHARRLRDDPAGTEALLSPRGDDCAPQTGPPRVPIFLRAAEFAQSGLGLAEYLEQKERDAFTAEPARVAAVLLRLLREDRCLVVVDGLDEIHDSGARSAFRGQVDDLIGDNECVVTSRVVGYRTGQLPVSRYFHALLCPMDRPQIEEFVGRWSRHAVRTWQDEETPEARTRAIVDYIFRTPGIRRLAGTPLLLRLLAAAYARGGANAALRHRASIYKIAVEELVERWNRGTRASGDLDVLTVYKLFAPLAHYLHVHRPSQLLTEEQATEQLQRRVELILEQARRQGVGGPLRGLAGPADVPDFLRRIRTHTGLFLERGAQLWGFSHLTFQEFFTAWHLVERSASSDQAPSALRLDLLLEHLHQPRWREPLLLAVGIAQADHMDGHTVIRAVLDRHSPHEDLVHRDLLFAAEALSEIVGMHGVDAGLVEEVLQRLLALVCSPGRRGHFPSLLVRIRALLARFHQLPESRGVLEALLVSRLSNHGDRAGRLAVVSLMQQDGPSPPALLPTTEMLIGVLRETTDLGLRPREVLRSLEMPNAAADAFPAGTPAGDRIAELLGLMWQYGSRDALRQALGLTHATPEGLGTPVEDERFFWICALSLLRRVEAEARGAVTDGQLDGRRIEHEMRALVARADTVEKRGALYSLLRFIAPDEGAEGPFAREGERLRADIIRRLRQWDAPQPSLTAHCRSLGQALVGAARGDGLIQVLVKSDCQLLVDPAALDALRSASPPDAELPEAIWALQHDLAVRLLEEMRFSDSVEMHYEVPQFLAMLGDEECMTDLYGQLIDVLLEGDGAGGEPASFALQVLTDPGFHERAQSRFTPAQERRLEDWGQGDEVRGAHVRQILLRAHEPTAGLLASVLQALQSDAMPEARRDELAAQLAEVKSLAGTAPLLREVEAGLRHPATQEVALGLLYAIDWRDVGTYVGLLRLMLSAPIPEARHLAALHLVAPGSITRWCMQVLRDAVQEIMGAWLRAEADRPPGSVLQAQTTAGVWDQLPTASEADWRATLADLARLPGQEEPLAGALEQALFSPSEERRRAALLCLGQSPRLRRLATPLVVRFLMAGAFDEQGRVVALGVLGETHLPIEVRQWARDEMSASEPQSAFVSWVRRALAPAGCLPDTPTLDLAPALLHEEREARAAAAFVLLTRDLHSDQARELIAAVDSPVDRIRHRAYHAIRVFAAQVPTDGTSEAIDLLARFAESASTGALGTIGANVLSASVHDSDYWVRRWIEAAEQPGHPEHDVATQALSLWLNVRGRALEALCEAATRASEAQEDLVQALWCAMKDHAPLRSERRIFDALVRVLAHGPSSEARRQAAFAMQYLEGALVPEAAQVLLDLVRAGQAGADDQETWYTAVRSLGWLHRQLPSRPIAAPPRPETSISGGLPSSLLPSATEEGAVDRVDPGDCLGADDADGGSGFPSEGEGFGDEGGGPGEPPPPGGGDVDEELRWEPAQEAVHGLLLEMVGQEGNLKLRAGAACALARFLPLQQCIPALLGLLRSEVEVVDTLVDALSHYYPAEREPRARLLVDRFVEWLRERPEVARSRVLEHLLAELQKEIKYALRNVEPPNRLPGLLRGHPRRMALMWLLSGVAEKLSQVAFQGVRHQPHAGQEGRPLPPDESAAARAGRVRRYVETFAQAAYDRNSWQVRGAAVSALGNLQVLNEAAARALFTACRDVTIFDVAREAAPGFRYFEPGMLTWLASQVAGADADIVVYHAALLFGAIGRNRDQALSRAERQQIAETLAGLLRQDRYARVIYGFDGDDASESDGERLDHVLYETLDQILAGADATDDRGPGRRGARPRTPKAVAEALEDALEELRAALDWDNTTGSARKWWAAFEAENSHRVPLLVRTAEAIKERNATITEFFLSYVYSDTDNIQANLLFLDYQRLRKREEGVVGAGGDLRSHYDESDLDLSEGSPLAIESAPEVEARIEALEQEMQVAGLNAAERRWWRSLTERYGERRDLFLSLLLALQRRKATPADLFLAWQQNGAHGVHANIAYLDYRRAVEEDEAGSAGEEGESPGGWPVDPAAEAETLRLWRAWAAGKALGGEPEEEARPFWEASPDAVFQTLRADSPSEGVQFRRCEQCRALLPLGAPQCGRCLASHRSEGAPEGAVDPTEDAAAAARSAAAEERLRQAFDGWCYGVSVVNLGSASEYGELVFRVVLPRLAEVFEAAIRAGYEWDILELSLDLSRAAKYLVDERAITFGVLAMLPEPASLPLQARGTFAAILDQAEQTYGDAVKLFDPSAQPPAEPEWPTPAAEIGSEEAESPTDGLEC